MTSLVSGDAMANAIACEKEGDTNLNPNNNSQTSASLFYKISFFLADILANRMDYVANMILLLWYKVYLKRKKSIYLHGLTTT